MPTTILISTYRKTIPADNTWKGLKYSRKKGALKVITWQWLFYGLNTRLLIDILKVKQVWLADDASSAGKVKDLTKWWDIIRLEGKKIGYYANETKSWIIIKDPPKLEEAKEQFGNSIKIYYRRKTTSRCSYRKQHLWRKEYVNHR